MTEEKKKNHSKYYGVIIFMILYVQGVSAFLSKALRIASVNDDVQTLLKNGYVVTDCFP